MKRMPKNNQFFWLLLFCFLAGNTKAQYPDYIEKKIARNVVTGADQVPVLLDVIGKKKVALIGNQTSLVGQVHLVDTLLKCGVKIKKVFSPEHGFRGKADAGEHVKNYKDLATGLPIISLYGKNYKPKASELKDVDIVIFDLQDVGARFYTYISTLYYAMEACSENDKQLIVLDRPNPNGFYVDGPVLSDSCKSYVGIMPIPIVHGCTVGELAGMIQGENWLKTGKSCKFSVIKMKNWNHESLYELPVKPSPNLPGLNAILLYPSLCLFEGTPVSVGRGTSKPFQQYGHPEFKECVYSFTPVSMPGAAKNPPFQDQVCFGFDLSGMGFEKYNTRKIDLSYIITAYRLYPDKEKFFNNYFKNLAGNLELKKQIIAGFTEEEIRKTWEPALSGFKRTREKYLLYE